MVNLIAELDALIISSRKLLNHLTEYDVDDLTKLTDQQNHRNEAIET